ncbi:MAG: glutathione S-transferase family protein [Alphaproteobacteria bacterium]|nr:glutathione S-transferase family protein [Alphaproteobacteria bacterium]
MITVTAYRWAPPFAQGLVRDHRVRWALEEAGLPYRERLTTLEEKESADYLRLQPFAQVPVYEEDGLVLFESGAIVLHIAKKSPALSPDDEKGRALMTQWVFAALNTIEPAVQPLTVIDLIYADEEWAKQRRPGAEEFARGKLSRLSARLGDKDYLEDRFTAGDLMMASVLRILRHTDLVARYPNLDAYLKRCEARPAFQKALADQMAAFKDAA